MIEPAKFIRPRFWRLGCLSTSKYDIHENLFALLICVFCKANKFLLMIIDDKKELQNKVMFSNNSSTVSKLGLM